MEPHFKKNINSQNSFKLKNTIGQSFDGLWHFHDEYELIYIWEGKGEKVVGDNISDLCKGDLLFFGSDLPHSFSCNQDFHNRKEAGSLVIHLNHEFLQEGIFACPEFHAISKLFERAKSGIQFNRDHNKEIKVKIQRMFGMNHFTCFLEIISTLNMLAHRKDYQLLISPGYIPTHGEKDYQRINEVYKYVMNNFAEEINLDTMGGITNLTKEAFCRHFKKVTGKTFFTYLNEYRIGYACKLLMDTNLRVTEICFDSGFNSISNFNKQFKKITEMNPSGYRNQFES
jgi:AraC-like DNA-binding protein